MPELPEVETTRSGIEPHVVGRRVTAVKVHDARLRWPVPADLPATLGGLIIQRVSRRGKYLLFETAVGWLLTHLGMSGSLRIVTGEDPRRKHDHVEILFEQGVTLRFHDPRRFGCMLWLQGDPYEHRLLAKLGPEPLGPAFKGEYLFKRSRGRSAPVKSFLMDAHVVVGVGNIYANEALFRAGIHPRRAAGRISQSRYESLAGHVKAVLGEAIADGGTTLRDFVNSQGSPGYFSQQLSVYGRGGLSCTSCTTPLKEIRLAQRTTVYCPSCQR